MFAKFPRALLQQSRIKGTEINPTCLPQDPFSASAAASTSQGNQKSVSPAGGSPGLPPMLNPPTLPYERSYALPEPSVPRGMTSTPQFNTRFKFSEIVSRKLTRLISRDQARVVFGVQEQCGAIIFKQCSESVV